VTFRSSTAGLANFAKERRNGSHLKM
jgi:hypothetical protein